MKTYKYKIITTSQVNMNEDLEKLQLEGWQVCGSITMNPDELWCGVKSIYVPIKQKIKPLKT